MTEKKTAAKAPAKKTAAPKKTAGRKKAASVAEFDAKSIKELKKEEKAAAAKVKKIEKKERGTGQLGHISQVMGAVVDVKFENVDELPNILTALECDNHGKNWCLKLPSIWERALFAPLPWIRPTVWSEVWKSSIPDTRFRFPSVPNFSAASSMSSANLSTVSAR